MSANILIVEDEPDLAGAIARGLRRDGHAVDIALTATDAEIKLRSAGYDLVCLDWTLPDGSGLAPCRDLVSGELPTLEGDRRRILMLTARDDVEDRVAGLDSGADNYLVKPFELQEVEVRLEVLATRGTRRASKEIQVGDLMFNLDTQIAARCGHEVDLNPIGLKLLRCLMEASPNVVSRAELEKEVWGEEMPDSDSLRVHIHSLRAAIDKPFGSKMIQTRHGIGYRLVESDAVQA